MNPMRMLIAGILLLVVGLFFVMFILPAIGIVILAPFAIGSLFTGLPLLWIAIALGAGIIVLLGWIPFLNGTLKLVIGFGLIVVAILLYMGVL
jgi:hypothetical protein